ncbi:MAG: hypothetical protein PSN36_04215 [Gammaproteobacteria bacterium]|nr:hypothetical protein [Gammaproteobacteria bacterium]
MANNDKQLQSQLDKLKVQAPSAYAVQGIIQKSKIQPNIQYKPAEIITLSWLVLPKKTLLLLALILGGYYWLEFYK